MAQYGDVTAEPGVPREELYRSWRVWVTTGLGIDGRLADIAANAATDAAVRGDGFNAAAEAARAAWMETANADKRVRGADRRIATTHPYGRGGLWAGATAVVVGFVSPATKEVARRTAWTQPLRWTFVGLQLMGIHLLGFVFFFATLIWWVFIYLIAGIFNRPTPSYWDTTTILVGAIFDDLKMQPWLLVVIGAALVASVCLIYGAFRFRVWAHWGAMVFIALLIAPPILITPIRDALGVMVWVYCAACISFLAAMTYAAIRYGPWGIMKPVDSRTDANLAPRS